MVGLRYAFTEIMDDLAVWLAIGLLAAALVATLVPPQALASWGSGWSAMLIMLVVGIPMYICASASTPLAAALLHAGISPGAALVFLLAGPATNMGTLAVVQRTLGTRALVSYLVGIVGGSLSFGFLTNWIAAATGWQGPEGAVVHAHEILPLWLTGGCAILLLICAIRPLRHALGRLFLNNR
jgi:hypothetical protein